MAGQVSKEKLGGVLMQAMRAQKNLRPQRDRLLQLRRRLQQQRLSPGGGDDDEAAFLKELAADLFKAHFFGIETGARLLGCCLQQALKGGARPRRHPRRAAVRRAGRALPPRAPDHPGRGLLPRRDRLQCREAGPGAPHLSRCIELLAGVRPPSHIRELPEESSMIGYSDDTVAAATAHIAKYGLPNLAKTAPATARRDRVTGNGKESEVASSKDPDQALSYLHRACSLLSLAVSHMDIAVAVLSGFVDPKEVASLSDFTDKCDGRSFAPSDSQRWLTA